MAQKLLVAKFLYPIYDNFVSNIFLICYICMLLVGQFLNNVL